MVLSSVPASACRSHSACAAQAVIEVAEPLKEAALLEEAAMLLTEVEALAPLGEIMAPALLLVLIKASALLDEVVAHAPLKEGLQLEEVMAPVPLVTAGATGGGGAARAFG